MQRLGMLKGQVTVNVPAETYEARRKRLGLDDMPPKEAHAKFIREHPEFGREGDPV